MWEIFLSGRKRNCVHGRPAVKLSSATHLVSVLITLVAINSLSRVHTAPVSTTQSVQTPRRHLSLNIVQTEPISELRSQRAQSRTKKSSNPESSTSPSAQISPKQDDPLAPPSTHSPPTPHFSTLASSPVSSQNTEADPNVTQSNAVPSNTHPLQTQNVQTVPPDQSLKSPSPMAKPSQSKLPSPEPTITPIPQQKPPPGTENITKTPQSSDVNESTSENSKNQPDKNNQSDGSDQNGGGSSSSPNLQTVSPLAIVGAGLSVLVIASIVFAYRTGLCFRLQSTLSDQPYEPVRLEPSSPAVPVNTNNMVDADGWNQDWDNDDWDIDDNRTKHEQSSSHVC